MIIESGILLSDPRLRNFMTKLKLKGQEKSHTDALHGIKLNKEEFGRSVMGSFGGLPIQLLHRCYDTTFLDETCDPSSMRYR